MQSKKNYRSLIIKKSAKLYQNLNKNIKFNKIYIIGINRIRDRRWIKYYINSDTIVD